MSFGGPCSGSKASLSQSVFIISLLLSALSEKERLTKNLSRRRGLFPPERGLSVPAGPGFRTVPGFPGRLRGGQRARTLAALLTVERVIQLLLLSYPRL